MNKYQLRIFWDVVFAAGIFIHLAAFLITFVDYEELSLMFYLLALFSGVLLYRGPRGV